MRVKDKMKLMEDVKQELCRQFNAENVKTFLREFNLPYSGVIPNIFGVGAYVDDKIEGISNDTLMKIAEELDMDISHLISQPTKPVTPKPTKPENDSSPAKAFISYETTDVNYANTISAFLKEYNIEAFVAYKDAREAEEFQEEILTALNKMDFFISIHTEQFSKSVWCQQEIGFAVAKGVKIIPVKLRTPPDGFIGKIHAIARDVDKTEAVVERILNILKNDPETKDLYSAKIADKVMQKPIEQLADKYKIESKRTGTKELDPYTRFLQSLQRP